jgi:hypothetical protein
MAAWGYSPPMAERMRGGGGPSSQPGQEGGSASPAPRGDADATLKGITAAVAAVPGAQESSITYIIGRRKVEPWAATGNLARAVDELHDRLQEGPCLDAVGADTVVRIDDMGAERRWPRFAGQAARLGARSALSFCLLVQGERVDWLNLYARTPHAFGEHSVTVGSAIAALASVAILGARNEEQLRNAVASRDLIGQAKGILMQRYKLTADQTFGTLTRLSQQTNRKLIDIADELTRTPSIPGPGMLHGELLP